MRINLAHGKVGSFDVAVFDAKPVVPTDSARRELLADLSDRARLAGLNVDRAALVFTHGDEIRFFGDREILPYLQRIGVPRWTHWIEV